MTALRAKLRDRAKPTYRRRTPLILINGLAEQTESWYCNVDDWRKEFDVHTPNLLVYEGAPLHRRIDAGQPLDIEFFVDRLHTYLEEYAQNAPYHLVANSLGGKIAVEYSARYPDRVSKLVLICPSGISDEERLPVVEGVRRNDPRSLVDSVFANPRQADPGLLKYYQDCFSNRRWKIGLLRTIRGTMAHRVRDQLARVSQPTLLVVGRQDRIVDSAQAIEAAALLPLGQLVVLENCGHAPQIEKAALINRLVADFLRGKDG
jgi:pimeloyl-ACP methyl ester carboxylesterase